MEAQLGKLEWAHLPGTLKYDWKGLWRWSVSLCRSYVKRTWRESSLAGDPEGYVEKALETGISFHRGPVWRTWRRARLLGTFRDGWKGLWGWSISLWKCSVEGTLGGSSFNGDPGRYVKKSPDMGIPLHGGPFPAKGNLVYGGGLVYRELWYMNEAFCEEFHEGDLERGLLYWEPKKLGFWEISKMPCEWAPLSIGALLRNLEGFVSQDFERREKYIWVPFLDRGH